jgi:hypothetical protein
MARAMTLPIVAGLAIVAGAVGAQLGRSAAAEINPAHFGAAPTRFHADLTPAKPDWGQVQVAEYSAPASEEGLGTGCAGCRTAPVQYYPQRDATLDAYMREWKTEPVRYAEAAPVAVVQEVPDEGRERIVRYASYRVDASEPEAQPDAEQAEPAPEEPADTQ